MPLYIEYPNHADGHLGTQQITDLNHEHFSFRRVLEETQEIFKQLGLEREKIPLILAGGMAHFKKIKTAPTEWGPNAVQIGTAFAVTQEGDAHINFKKT